MFNRSIAVLFDLRLVVLFLLFKVPLLALAQEPTTTDRLERVIGLQQGFKLTADTLALRAYFKGLKAIKKSWEDQRQMTGKTTIGYNGDFQPGNDLFKMFGSVELSRGSFPSQLRVAAGVAITLQNGEFQENISEVRISYNYHPNVSAATSYARRDSLEKVRKGTSIIKERDRLRWENFSYLSRFSDNFLNIEQRYELVLGRVLAWYSDALQEKVVKKETQIGKVLLHDTLAVRPVNRIARAMMADTLSKDDLEAIREAHNRAKATLQKDGSKWRTGILFGVMGEVERNGTVKDSLFVGDVLTAFSYAPETTMRLRFEMRPFVRWSPTHRFTVKWNPYFVLPTWDMTSIVTGKTLGGEEYEDRRYDWRLDSQFEVSIAMDNDDDASNKEVSMGLSYRVLYDHAPARSFTGAYDERGIPLLVSSPDVHNIVLLKFTVAI